jgi:hypothetical protein
MIRSAGITSDHPRGRGLSYLTPSWIPFSTT